MLFITHLWRVIFVILIVFLIASKSFSFTLTMKCSNIFETMMTWKHVVWQSLWLKHTIFEIQLILWMSYMNTRSPLFYRIWLLFLSSSCNATRQTNNLSSSFSPPTLKLLIWFWAIGVIIVELDFVKVLYYFSDILTNLCSFISQIQHINLYFLKKILTHSHIFQSLYAHFDIVKILDNYI